YKRPPRLAPSTRPVLNVLATHAVPTRRDSDQTSEVTGEVALIREARLGRGVRDRRAPPQQRLHACHAQLGLERVRGHSVVLDEDAVKMEGAEGPDAREGFQRNVLGEVLDEEIAGAFERAALRAERARWRTALRVTRDQRGEKLEEQQLSLEA